MIKNFFISILGILLTTPSVYSQGIQTWTENFDGATVSMSSTPANAWTKNNTYFVNAPNSYRGTVPHTLGDSVILTTSSYDLSSYSNVRLRFNHICKVSPMDVTRIEYRISGQAWKPILFPSYMGKANNYAMTGFNAESYPEWQANDSTVKPDQSWWKEETFDLSFETGGENSVEFRFIIKHGTVSGSQVSYGWLLDDFELSAATYDLNLPVVEFIAPLIWDTVYSTGPWEVNARVKSAGITPLLAPYLQYTATQNGSIIESDSIPMTMVIADSLWKAAIPLFEAGTTVSYSITGMDTNGLHVEASSQYTIVANEGNYKIIGTDNDSVYYQKPANVYWGGSYSRQLYYGTEFFSSAEGAIITKLAWESSYSYAWNAIRQSCYFRAVDDTEINTSDYSDPVADGATLVWEGTLNATSEGWIEVSLDNPFKLPQGKNLMVYWNHDGGDGNYVNWYHSITPVNTVAYGYETSFAEAISPDNWNKYNDNYRPNARFYAYPLAINMPNNSVALQSIDMPDSVIVASGVQVPIVVTIKNKGTVNLTSATFNYSINGGVIQSSPTWSGNLPWDFDSIATIGSYTPTPNGNDEITVWVTMPNTVADEGSTADDTLTKFIYGNSDLQLSFVNSPSGIVYNTGTYNINARINSLSGATTINSVSLKVDTSCVGTPTTFTLPMTFDPTDNLWKATIPHTLLESDVTYSITLTDARNNIVSIADSFHSTRPERFETTTIQKIVGTDVMTQSYAPIDLNENYSWSRQLYLGSEISSTGEDVTITSLAWDYADPSGYLYTDAQICYFLAVNDIEISSDNYSDPYQDGAEYMWYGYIENGGGTGWAKITFDFPFVLPAGMNLLIYWGNEAGWWDPDFGGYWNATQTPFNSTAYGSSGSDFDDATFDANLSDIRPNARFGIETTVKIIDQDTSVALVAIESPSISETAGIPVPVRVRIRNTGTHHLDSCVLNWSLNGTQMDTIYWKGHLPEDFTDTVTIGTYTSTAQQSDEIVVWVSMPNGIPDAVTKDDRLELITLGCGGTLSGTIDVGSGKRFQTLAAATTAARDCGITGDVTLVLWGDYNEDVDLSNINTNGHHLTITSDGNNPDNAKIIPSYTGITLGNNKNITIQAITIDATFASNCIEFVSGACTNIVIRDCKLLADTTIYTYNNPIVKYSSGLTDSIFIINNLLDGGYNGFFFIGGAEFDNTRYGKNLVFDSNTLSNQSAPITVSFTNFARFSNNTLLNRSTCDNDYGAWYVFSMQDNNGINITNNRIIQRAASIEEEVYGMNVFANGVITDTGIIANNEIIINGSYSYASSHGISVKDINSKILHNSIYVSGMGTSPRGISAIGAGFYEIKNNNIYLEASDGHPISLGSQLYDVNSNNMYAPTYVGDVVGTPVETIADWQQMVTTDNSSVKVFPHFTAPTTSLELSSISGMLCNIHPDVPTDINNTTRSAITTVGAYTQPISNQDLRLLEITQWEDNCLINQPIQINVDVQNLCNATPVSTIVFGYSINDAPPSFATVNMSPDLQPYETRNITVTTFTAIGADTFHLSVWVESIDGLPDLVNWNDTLSAFTIMEPLVEFVAPFVSDTINNLTFEVNAFIRTKTGAPSPAPTVTLRTLIEGESPVYDTIAMVLNGDIWSAQIPQQYFGSTVIYSITVFDTLNSSVTVTDTTYIQYIDGSNDRYAGYDLAILAITEPETWTGAPRLCPDEYLPLKVVLANLGEKDYAFLYNNITLTVEASHAGNYSFSKVINDGILTSGSMDTIEVTPLFPVYFPGQYNIKVWLTSATDNIKYDDTIRGTYTSERLGLPVEEDFEGGLSSEFTVNPVNSPAIWTIVSQGSGIDASVFPQNGSNMLSFTGNIGAMSHLVTRQLELRGTMLPSLQFWYFHDTVETEDYTDVFITTDGGVTYTLLETVYKQNPVYGWKEYIIDLAPYANGQCVNILFEAMQMSSTNVTQYLDHISISSIPDLEVAEILISPEITACNITNKSLSVVLNVTTNQTINLNQTSLAVEVPGYSTFTHSLQGITMSGNSTDTFLIDNNINFAKGSHNIRAYLTSPVDNYHSNDTANRRVEINPNLSISSNPVSAANSCLIIGMDIHQKVMIRNTGNLDISNINLVMEIDTGDIHTTRYVTVNDNYAGTISAGDSVEYTFTNTYNVPQTTTCYLRITASMSCNPSMVSATAEPMECVDIHDLSIKELVSPGNTADVRGSAENITVSITNTSDVKTFSAVTITAIIESEQGQSSFGRVSVIDNVEPSKTIPFTFPETYNVPDDSVYYITIYLSSVDNYLYNDTLKVKRTTEPGNDIKTLNGKNAFTLGQNIPNPANSSTRIDYNLPEAGVVTFHVYDVSGQLLYSKTIETNSGTHSLELDTRTLASGIYFYSMEHKGQRLVKRMSVQ